MTPGRSNTSSILTRGETTKGVRHQIGTLSGFVLECMAGFIGICSLRLEVKSQVACLPSLFFSQQNGDGHVYPGAHGDEAESERPLSALGSRRGAPT